MRRLCWILLLSLLGCEGSNSNILRVTGQIQGKAVHAGSRVGGRVTEVQVEEGDFVQAGDVLVRLDDAEAQAMVSAAAAKLAACEAALAKLEAGATEEQLRQAEAAARAAEEQYRLVEKGARSEEVRAAKAALDAAKSQWDTAKVEFDRVDRLLKQAIATQSQFDQAQMALETAEAQHRAAREKYELVLSGARTEEIAMAEAAFDRAAAALDELRRGARAEDLAAARAARDAAQADLDRANVALREMSIIAPQNGRVESVDVRRGDLIKPGPAVRIMDPDDLELVIYVSAAMLGHVAVGQKVARTTDVYGEQTFEGTVTYIASEGEYTPRNLQTQEERVQQVFGVKIKLDSAGGKLRAGMTVTVEIPLANGVR